MVPDGSGALAWSTTTHQITFKLRIPFACRPEKITPVKPFESEWETGTLYWKLIVATCVA